MEIKKITFDDVIQRIINEYQNAINKSKYDNFEQYLKEHYFDKIMNTFEDNDIERLEFYLHNLGYLTCMLSNQLQIALLNTNVDSDFAKKFAEKMSESFYNAGTQWYVDDEVNNNDYKDIIN